MAIDPFDHNNVLYGCQLILKTTNGGQSWTELSPDLSTKDPSRIVSNGGIVGDNLGQYAGEVVWDIEYSKIQQRPDLGRHQRRQALVHEGRRRELDRRHEELQGPAGVGHVHADLAVDVRSRHRHTSRSSFHLMDDRKPYIYKTTDFGATWTKITGNIPTGHPLDYVLSFVGQSRTRKGCSSPAPAARSTTRWTTARRGRASRTDCRRRR